MTAYDTESWAWKIDQRAAVLLERQASEPPPCCCEHRDAGWYDAGCRLHRPVRSFAEVGWRA